MRIEAYDHLEYCLHDQSRSKRHAVADRNAHKESNKVVDVSEECDSALSDLEIQPLEENQGHYETDHVTDDA